MSVGRFNIFPEEIMLEILTRVPVNSVLDCKLVCKPWRDLVRHPPFSQMHLNNLDSGKSSFIFTDNHTKGLDELSYAEYDENCHEKPFMRVIVNRFYVRSSRINPTMNFYLPFEEISFVGSCNGLICLDGWLKDEISIIFSYICNPITREYIILPRFKGNFWHCGFGHSPSTNEYKVVRMYDSERGSKVQTVQVYTLGSGNGWRNVGTVDINRACHQCIGTFVNGALHWADCGKNVLVFHLTNEKFSEIPLPPGLPISKFILLRPFPFSSIILAALGGSLSAIVYRTTDSCDIWLLKKNKDNTDLSWSKQFTFDRVMPRPIELRLMPIELTKSGTLLYYMSGTIYSYNPKAPSDQMPVSVFKGISQAIPHKNTLVSLKVLAEEDTKTMESCERIEKLKKPHPHDKRSLGKDGSFLSVVQAPFHFVSSIIWGLAEAPIRYCLWRLKTLLRRGLGQKHA